MKKAKELKKDDLEKVLTAVQAYMYTDTDEESQGELTPFWNPDNGVCQEDILSAIDDVLAQAGLKPEKVSFLDEAEQKLYRELAERQPQKT